MREILFRGKRIDNDEWVEGSLLYDSEQNESYIAEYFEDKAAYIREVIPETVGQYIEARDCKRTEKYPEGEMIFEGDIVQHYDNSDNCFDIGVVYWDDKYLGWRRTSIGGAHGVREWTYKINTTCKYKKIGNIHDNPELLEVSEDE